MAKGQAEAIVPMIDALLAKHALHYRDLAGIGVGVGPGNFTGVRISVALARGLALGLGIPAIGVTAFEATAVIANAKTAVWAVVNAPRGQFYAQRFDDPKGSLRGVAQTCDVDDLATFDADIIRSADQTADRLVAAIGQIGLGKLGSPHRRPTPFYLRGADAAPSSDPPPVILP